MGITKKKKNIPHTVITAIDCEKKSLEKKK